MAVLNVFEGVSRQNLQTYLVGIVLACAYALHEPMLPMLRPCGKENGTAPRASAPGARRAPAARIAKKRRRR